MSMIYDEYGRPFIILKEQQSKSRVKGLEATKSNVLAARTISKLLRTSLGPKGLDKMLVSPDGDVTITNDGATILQELQVDHPVARCMVELSRSQDEQIGDGTTGVVVLAGSLLEQAEHLLKKGIHPVRIAEGFEKAAGIAMKTLEGIAESMDIHSDDHAALRATAETTLRSKILQSCKGKMADIAVRAVLKVADLDRRDVNMERIRVEGKTGGTVADAELVDGIVIDKEWSHNQMAKSVGGGGDGESGEGESGEGGASLCLLTCPFEPPKPKTKHKLDIGSREAYEALYAKEQEYFRDMVRRVKDSGANVVICQWGFDDEANHLLYREGLGAVRWVGGVEMEHIAMATGGRMVPRFEEVSSEKLGHCRTVREVTFGNNKERMLVLEHPVHTTAVTILVRGGNRMIVDEAKRSLHDAMCVARNLIVDNRVVYGGGAAEIACSLAIAEAARSARGADQYALAAFGKALEDIPAALAENAGWSPMEQVAAVKREQVRKGTSVIGLLVAPDDDTNDHPTESTSSSFFAADMRQAGVFETLTGKQQQVQLAAQVVKMILKIDDVISPGAQLEY